MLLPSLAWLPVEPGQAWIRLTAITLVAVAVTSALLLVRRPWGELAGWQAGGAFAAVLAIGGAAGDAIALGYRLGWEQRWTAFAVVAVVAVAVGAAAAIVHRSVPISVALEVTAIPAAMVAIGLTGGHLWQSGQIFALIAAISAVAALRADRRFLGYVAAVALMVASWYWLDAAAVHLPEAYTLPAVLALLGFRLAWATRRPPSLSATLQVAAAGILAVLPSVLWLSVAPTEAWIRLTALVIAALLLAVVGGFVRLPWPVPGTRVSGWQLIGELAAGAAVLAATLDAVVAGFHFGFPASAIAYAVLMVGGAVAVAVAALVRHPWYSSARAPDSGAVAASARVRLALVLEAAALPAGLAAVGLTVGQAFHTGLVLFLAGLVVGLHGLRPDRRMVWFVAIGLELMATWSWLVAARIGTPEAYTLPAAGLAIAGGFWMSRRWPQLLSWVTFGPGVTGLLLPSLAMTFLVSTESWRPFALGAAALAVTLLGAYRRRQAPFLIAAAILAVLAVHELSPRWSPMSSPPCRAGSRSPSAAWCCWASAPATNTAGGTSYASAEPSPACADPEIRLGRWVRGVPGRRGSVRSGRGRRRPW
nr:hypothetical protein [Fodinicola feengrottensis]